MAPRPMMTAALPVSGGISLSPSVVMLNGSAGQGHRQVLTLTNSTLEPMTFDLTAEDVVADGSRHFVRAGERPDSIAATAVFTPAVVTVPPGRTGTTQLTVTVPRQTAVRAIAAIFRSRTPTAIRPGVGITASLGALLTFTLSQDARIETSSVSVEEQSDTTNLRIVQTARNVGSEPLFFGGAAAILDDTGALVARIAVDAQRLLPGERLTYRAEYPSLLAPGRYRAIFSLAHAHDAQSTAVDFAIPPASSDQRFAGRVGDGRDR
jgi:hypothetical protein